MIRIIVVDDQTFTRKVINTILENDSDFLLVGEAGDGIKALEIISEVPVDIAIVDLNMPGMDGFELTREICHNYPRTKVIILSGNDDRYSINKAVKFGARGYLLKNSFTENEIRDTINNVQRGYFQLGPGLFENLISDLINSEIVASKKLSQMEKRYHQDFALLKREILLLNKEVRHQLFQEIHSEIEAFKVDCREGLNHFQERVSGQIENGLKDLAIKQQDSQIAPELWNKRYAQLNQNISLIDNRHGLFLNNLKKEIIVLRYCIIFLLIGFVPMLLNSLFNF